MMVVIQCAGSKRAGAGYLISTDRKPVIFVADPEEAARRNPGPQYARPDDPSGSGRSWRQELVEYNASNANPLRLCCAYELYKNKTYRSLVDQLGVQNVFVLSAGWGLITADYLIPDYDITFSHNPKKPYTHRRKSDRYEDFRMLPVEKEEDVFFFGGKAYLDQFVRLTKGIKGKRTVFYNSSSVPHLIGCVLQRFETSKLTNWHYDCASAFLDGAARIR